MFVCRTCGALFSTPAFNKNKSECPECGSANFSEANYCKVCHDYLVAPSYQEYCPDCVLNAEDQLRSAVAKWVDPDYIELLKDEYPDIGYIMGDDA